MQPDASGRSAEAEAWAKKRKAAMQKAAQAKLERQQRPPLPGTSARFRLGLGGAFLFVPKR